MCNITEHCYCVLSSTFLYWLLSYSNYIENFTFLEMYISRIYMYIFWIYRILRTILSLPFEIQNLPSYLLGMDYPRLVSWTLSTLLAYGFLFYNFISVFILRYSFYYFQIYSLFTYFYFYHMYFYISM